MTLIEILKKWKAEAEAAKGCRWNEKCPLITATPKLCDAMEVAMKAVRTLSNYFPELNYEYQISEIIGEE